MKGALSILVAVMMLVCAMSLSASAAQTYNAVYGMADIDGVASAGEWDDAVAVEMAVKTNPGKQLSENPTMKVMNDGVNMYVLIEAKAPDTNVNTFICVHLPHEGCEPDGCESYLKVVCDGKRVADGTNKFWAYAKDRNHDGVNDYAGTDGSFEHSITAACTYANDTYVVEFCVPVNNGEAIPAGAASVDIRIDADTVWATHQWANQMRTWDATFNPAWDGGTMYFLAEGEEAPAETEPVTEEVTEPATEEVTEPATEEATEPATEEVTEPATEKETEKATEPATEKVEDTADDKGGISPIVWIVIAVVVVAAVVAGVVIAKKKK